jgi:hypothetical protein
MDEPQLLTAALTEHARRITPGPVSVADLIARGHRRRSRHRAVISSAVALCAAIAIGLPLLVILGVHRDRASIAPTRPVVPVVPVVNEAVALAHGHWSTLPTAPIAGRDGAVSTWTGSQMLIWGGTANGVAVNDGAAYDPATRVWQKMPVSALEGRINAASVWTGSQFFIWGGSSGLAITCPPGGCSDLRDGALYDPKTLTWTSVSSSPVANYTWAQAFWLNGRVIVLTMPASANKVTSVDADAYNPVTNRWARLPSQHVAADRPIREVSAAAAGPTILVWSTWQRDLGGGGLQSGVDSYVFDTLAKRWAAGSVPANGAVVQPLSAGNEVIVPTISNLCPSECPYAPPRPGYFVTSTGRLGQSVPLGPVSGTDATYLWAGNALVGFDTYSGEGAVWSALSHIWTPLPREALTGDHGQIQTIWDGKALLVWGFSPPVLGGKKYPTSGLMFG